MHSLRLLPAAGWSEALLLSSETGPWIYSWWHALLCLAVTSADTASWWSMGPYSVKSVGG